MQIFSGWGFSSSESIVFVLLWRLSSHESIIFNTAFEVLELVKNKRMYEDFTCMLVDHKVREMKKIPNIQLRSAMISAWKDDMLVALLDNHTIDKFKASTDKFKVSTDNQMRREWLQQCIEINKRIRGTGVRTLDLICHETGV